MNRIRIIDIANSETPDLAFKYVLFKRLVQEYPEREIYDFSIRHNLNPIKSTNPYIRRLDAIRSNIFRSSQCLHIPFTVGLHILKYFGTILYIFAWKLKFSRSKLLKHILKSKIDQISIGDCLFSAAVRLDFSDGHQKLNIVFLIFWIKFMIRYFFAHDALRIIEKTSASKKLFYCNETTYLPEAYRRLLLANGYREIRYDQFRHQLREFEPLIGYELCVQKHDRVEIYKAITDIERALAEEKLRKLVFREETYCYMNESDINTSLRLILDRCPIEIRDKVAVIFLHAISDAQYYFGPDCFLDLHDWLVQSIQLLRSQGIQVIIKLHPSCFNVKYHYPVDAKYLKVLEGYFDICIQSLPLNEPIPTNQGGVYLLHYKVALAELSRTFRNFLCITHHGTVACEAAYLGHSVLCSWASPYLDQDLFLQTYRTVSEYQEYIRIWKQDGTCIVDRRSLDNYVYAEQFLRRLNRLRDYFIPLILVDSDGSQDMNLLQQFILLETSKDPKFAEHLDETIYSNLANLLDPKC